MPEYSPLPIPIESDLTYDRSIGALYCWSTGDVWKANSGWKGANRPGAQAFRMPRNWEYGEWGAVGRDPLPSGRYRCGLQQLKSARKKRYKNKRGFTDPQNFYWFLHIIRVDDTGTDRGEFGIHPDGFPVGTKGCIGLTASSTKPIYEKLEKLIKTKGEISIDVI